ncbi:MAG TPA: hypothetical protein VIL48_07150 [Acidimicrobiales bacterium]
MNRRVNVSWVTVIWIVIGVIVAINQNYGENLDSGSRIATFVLAVILWPILALGGDVGIRF